MSTPARRGRLPGGLPLWRARWALRRAHGFVAPFEDGGIDAAGQPALLRLVSDVAFDVEARAPDRVWLRGCGGIDLTVRDGRIELWLSLPLLLIVPAEEIRTLVAHELATVDPVQTDLVAQLYRLREHVSRDRVMRLVHRRRRRTYRPARTVRGLVAAVEARADAAASRIAGARRGAAALAKATLFCDDCGGLVGDVEDALGNGDLNAGLVDVFALWLDRIGRYGPGQPDRFDRYLRRGLAERHPGLAAEIADLRPDELDPDPSGPPVELAPFSAEEARALAADAFGEPYERWMSAADVPTSVWLAGIQAAGEQALHVVPRPADREALGVADAMAEIRDLWRRDSDTKLAMLIALAEYTLVPAGWRRAHPVLAGVLIDPSGTEHDLRAMAQRALTDTNALTELTRLIEKP